MGKKSPEPTRNVSTSKVDPQVMSMLTNNYNQANAIASKPFEAFGGERVAGFNDTQTQSQNMFKSIGAAGQSAGLTDAMGTTRGLTQFMPQNITGAGYEAAQAGTAQINRGDVRNVTAGQLKGADLSAYMNPYEDAVVGTTLADQERARQIALVNDRNRAGASNAFGGDRHAVLESLTNEANDRNTGSLVAQLRMAGYDKATGNATNDINRTFAADQANQGVDLSVQGQNTALAQQAMLANQGATNTAAEFGAAAGNTANLANQQAGIAGAGIRRDSANSLAAMADQALQEQIKRTGLVAAVGDSQQGQAQAINDAAYEEYLRRFGYDAEGQAMRNAALGLIPAPINTTQVGSGGGPSKGQQIKDGLGTAASIASLFMGSDARIKTDVTTAGYDAEGRRWVDFRYVWDEPGTKRRGVIAQEVAKTDPDAVAIHPMGFLMVDYAQMES